LEKQLAGARLQVQDISVKAIEGASGARALAHINRIAMEQAKDGPRLGQIGSGIGVLCKDQPLTFFERRYLDSAGRLPLGLGGRRQAVT